MLLLVDVYPLLNYPNPTKTCLIVKSAHYDAAVSVFVIQLLLSLQKENNNLELLWAQPLLLPHLYSESFSVETQTGILV